MKFKAASAILFLAVSAVADFPAGNQAFDRGHYEKAILEYEKILAKGHVSSALHHNLANAYLEHGREQGGGIGTGTTSLGRAIYHYRLARRLNPRDTQNRANLLRAREVVHGQPPREPPLRVFTGWLTLNEWAGAASLCLTLSLLLLTARQVHAPWQNRWGIGAHLLLGVGAGLGAMAWAAWDYQSAEDEALTIRETPLYKRPLTPTEVPESVAPSHTDPDPISDGIELNIMDRRNGGWLKVAFEEGALRRSGWIQQATSDGPNLLVFPP